MFGDISEGSSHTRVLLLVVRHFRPRMSLERIYDAVDPLLEWGAGAIRVLRASRLARR